MLGFLNISNESNPLALVVYAIFIPSAPLDKKVVRLKYYFPVIRPYRRDHKSNCAVKRLFIVYCGSTYLKQVSNHVVWHDG